MSTWIFLYQCIDNTSNVLHQYKYTNVFPVKKIKMHNNSSILIFLKTSIELTANKLKGIFFPGSTRVLIQNHGHQILFY